MYKNILFLLFFCLFAACASLPSERENFIYREVSGERFTLASWQKITKPQETYKIYIEGDGHVFTAFGKPSLDPTPKSKLVRTIAFSDPSENVIYLARPCQFVKTAACNKYYWTSVRFSEEVINAFYGAVKSIAGNNPVILIGYSGGAQIAGLTAVLYKDLNVKKIITLAGNLDHAAWQKTKKCRRYTVLLTWPISGRIF